MEPTATGPRPPDPGAPAAEWNFADVWEAVAQACPERPAQVHGGLTLTWREFDQRANGIADWLLRAGCRHQDKVALYLYNGPEYLQAAFACLKVSLVPVNTNYRYKQQELRFLWDNADASAVVFDASFTATIEEIRAQCPKVRAWLYVGDPALCPGWASALAAAAPPRAERPQGARPRSGDDLVLVYTGGTTGHPRGVMWRQHDLYIASNTTADPAQADLGHVRRRVTDPDSAAPVGLPAAPLMHGTAYVFASTILNRGGTVVTLTSRTLDMTELLDAVQDRRVTELCIVGDAFCRPMVDALDAEPARWDLSSLKAVSSSGMMWSPANKQRLLEHARHAVLVDFLNSSEASGMGRAVSSRERASEAARFKLGKNAVVLDAEGRPLPPGSPEVGRIAVRGGVPLGYYGDPQKTAATFPVIDGVRYAIPGDFARVEADGSVTLLGRGSVSINSGGEKVFPEEVEECIKLLPQVRDTVVVGIPHERFGESVAAVVELAAGAQLAAETLIQHVRDRLAGHKVPRHVVFVDSVGRGPNGKADYLGLRSGAGEAVRARTAP
ncbi:AMP-binding protein [Ramlibacter sp. MAHUQ-53]|uniref:AMP-binding protein n=1 Tax=unclassified Ramlibacter TaxID=2617605 RepID=UPI00363BC3C6